MRIEYFRGAVGVAKTPRNACRSKLTIKSGQLSGPGRTAWTEGPAQRHGTNQKDAVNKTDCPPGAGGAGSSPAGGAIFLLEANLPKANGIVVCVAIATDYV